MRFKVLLHTEKHILSQGSLYELLRRSPDVIFDEHIFHAGLIYNDHYAKILEGVFRSYIDAAVISGLSITVATATWRANQERIKASVFSGRSVNEDNVAFLNNIRKSYVNSGISILLKGDIGPRGDAYKPSEALDINSAKAFHSPQINSLASSDVDYLQASTLPALSEAIGIALVMSKTELPYVISFVVDDNGRLLDGTMLSEAISRIDNEVGNNLTYFSINCVHPSIAQKALDKNPSIKERVISFSGNTSDLSADELNNIEELQTQDPAEFALSNKQLLDNHHIKIVGACCGSNPDHIQAISSILKT